MIIAVLYEELLIDGEENQNKSVEFEIPQKTTNDASNENGKPIVINCSFYNLSCKNRYLEKSFIFRG